MGKDVNIKQRADKGWKSMRQTLDREMPEEKRSRRAAWWWAAALLLLSFAFLGGRQWWNGTQKTPVSAVAVPVAVSPDCVKPTIGPNPIEMPSPGLVSASSAAENRKNASENTAQSSIPAPELSKNKLAKGPVSGKTAGPSHPAHLVRRLPQTPPSAWVDATDTDKTAVSPGNAPQSPTLASTTTAEPISIKAEMPETAPLLEKTDEMTTIPSDFRTLSPVLPLPEEGALAQTPLLKQPKKATRWHLGVSANAFTTPFSAFNGFSAGAVAEWQPLRRWGLRSGLLYAHQQTSGSAAYPVTTISAYDYYTLAIVDVAKAQFVLDNSTMAPIVAGNAVSLDSLRTETIYAPVNGTHRLELPIIPFFQLSSRLRCYGGASLNYLLRANVRSEAIVGSRLLQQAAQGNVALLRSTDPAALRRLVTAALPAFDARLNLGFGWRLAKRMELHANWQHSFRFTRQETTASAYNGNPNFDHTSRTIDISRNVFPSVFALGATVYLR